MNNIEKAVQQVLFSLRLEGFTDSAPSDEIDKAIDNTLQIYPVVDKKELSAHVQSEFSIWMDDDFKVITKEEARKPWLYNKKATIKWKLWERYKWYLSEKKKFPPKTLSVIDKLTDETLDVLFDPTIKGQIDKRGMIVGQVQSGKTANYTGLLCKAADAGFNLIIILAGIHNNLRSQTQLRIDEGFLGFDTQHQRAFKNSNKWIGVGELKSKRNIVAHSLTSSMEKGDFTAGAANSLGLNFQTNEPIIAVVKKNASVLRRLYEWLSAQTTELQNGQKSIQNKNLLLIDDEADNASINTKKDDLNPTTINGLLRDILRLFNKSAYVGYTATPFANIFIPINDDNLFPRDFIINIPAPTNYIGPQKIFGFEPYDSENPPDDTLPVVRPISDYEDFVPPRHKKDDQLPVSLPESLKTAIKSFIITCAIRRVRGQENKHNSMLVHVTRFKRWQTGVKELVQSQTEYYQRCIDQNVQEVIEEFRQIYEIDTDNYKSFVTTTRETLNSELADLDPNVKVHSWQEVLSELNEAASRIQVLEIHGGAKDSLNYYDYEKTGLSAIAVGGNKLSRGLTLEGLSVSYYLRASRMYDTLMQMGRWFGYRPGYMDLCRLFTSTELNEWFCHITLASEELRKEFDYMTKIAGSTPEQYALKVRTHPGVLQVSATNKIRSVEYVNVSWSGRLVETYKLATERTLNEQNLSNLETLINNLPENEKLLWYDISHEIILPFIRNFKTPLNPASNPEYIATFIEDKVKQGELTSWRVAIMSRNNSPLPHKLCNKYTVGTFERSRDKKHDTTDYYYITKSRIISPKDQFIDLSEEEYNYAMRVTKERYTKRGTPKYPSGNIVRNEIRKPENPLLLIYLFNPKGAGVEDDTFPPITGFAISFPGSKINSFVSYAVHGDLLHLFDTENETEDYEDYDDED